MEPHTLLQQPMNAAQKRETFIPNVSCAIPKKRAKGKKKKELKQINTFIIQNSTVSYCLLSLIIILVLYLHPQTRLEFHPQFLGNSCDVSLWLSAGHTKKR